MDAEAKLTRPDRAGTHLVGVHVPADVRRALRLLAAENGTTLSEEMLIGLRLRFQAKGRIVPALDALLEELRLNGRRRAHRY
jgi:hypothetical protein